MGMVNLLELLRGHFRNLVHNLVLNQTRKKSQCFFGGLSSLEHERIYQILPFYIDKLPVRYLDVPLVTKQISVKYCKPLVEKVKGKVKDWKNIASSYVWRLKLIASIRNANLLGPNVFAT